MKAEFNHKIFFGTIFNITNDFYKLLTYVNDPNALYAHSKTIYDSEKKQSFDLLTPEKKRDVFDMVSFDINSTTDLIIHHMIVVMATIIETINNDFFYCVFLSNPERIKYCTSIKGITSNTLDFSLEEFLKYKTKGKYLEVLCKRASLICNNGPIEKVLKRMNQLTGIEFYEDIKNRLNKVFQIRNLYVHENKLTKIKIDEVTYFNDSILTYLDIVIDKLREYKIEIIDPFPLKTDKSINYK